MASGRRLNYQWRLFFPLAVALWTLIAVMFYVQFMREREAKLQVLHSQIQLVNDRIMEAYNTDIDMVPFLRFISTYTNKALQLEDIRVSVYDLSSDMPIYTVGKPLPIPPDELIEKDGNIIEMVESQTTDVTLYKSAQISSDGKICVITAMPFRFTLPDVLGNEPDAWIIALMLAIAATILAFVSTRYLGRNIRLLRDFTDHAAAEGGILPERRFPNDELGDISRQIVNIYNKRIQANKDLAYEHTVAIKATQEKSRIKRALTNNLNHELKTPVGIVKGYIDTILEDPSMPPEQQRSFLAKASANIDRLCAMLNDISTITRLEENGENVPTEALDFHDLVFTVADEITESGMLGNFKFKYEIPFDCIVRGNGNLLRGLIMNLVKNAISYSQGSLIELRLVNQNEKYYTFAFFDNGVGVGEKHLPYLFDRFYRVDSGRSRKVGGSGLGLPIVKNTVVSLGGTISVQNRAEGGLEFMFTLPKIDDPVNKL